MLRLAYVLCLAVAAGGCTLHFGGDDDPTCDLDTNGAAEPAYQLRDPSTLQCTSFGGGYCPDPSCPCAAETDYADPVPIPTWGVCGSSCDGLAEDVCVQATECRAAYDYACYTGDGPCTAEVPFIGCFPTDQQGPIMGGGCLGLDAWSCSQHNDCVALHTQLCDASGCVWQFISCDTELIFPPCDVTDCG